VLSIRRGDLLGQRDGRLRARLADMRVHVARVREPPADVFARLGRRNELHPGADLHRERQESAKCSHGSPSGKDITSGKRANDRKAA
jgi:hypothetical protein